MPIRDNKLVFNSNATIGASSYSAIVAWNRTADTGVWVEIVHTGAITGTGPQLTAQLQYSDSATFAGIADLGPTIVIQNGTAGFKRAVLCQTRKAYARIAYTVTGTLPSFSGIYAHVVSGPQRDDVPGVNTV